MPRDFTPQPIVRPPASLLACCSQRRAELFSALNRLSLIRRHGPNPRSRELRNLDVALVKAANKIASKVLP